MDSSPWIAIPCPTGIPKWSAGITNSWGATTNDLGNHHLIPRKLAGASGRLLGGCLPVPAMDLLAGSRSPLCARRGHPIQIARFGDADLLFARTAVERIE